MAKLRFRLTIKPEAGHGVKLSQLGKVADEASKFLDLLGQDLSADLDLSDWLAVAPRKGSFAFDIVASREVPSRKAVSYRSSIARLARGGRSKAKPPAKLRRETLLQYAKLGGALDENERIEIGVYEEGAKKATPVGSISRDDSIKIVDSLGERVEYIGSAQGTIHNLNKGASPAFFQLRELSSRSLIRCEFKPEHYSAVVSALKNPNAVVLASGLVLASREHRSIERIILNDLREAEDLSVDEFDSLFGAAPGLTGSRTTEEFIDWVRGDDE